MSNVVDLRPGGAGERPLSSSQVAVLLTQVRDLLDDTANSLNESPHEANGCHLAAVEKTKTLLGRILSDGLGEEVDGALEAMSMVELARITIVAGFEAFQGGGYLTQSITIANALEAASARLEGESDA